jgi:hypothetical protein
MNFPSTNTLQHTWYQTDSLSCKTSPPASPSHATSADDLRANTAFNKRHSGLKIMTTLNSPTEVSDLSPTWLTPRHINQSDSEFSFNGGDLSKTHDNASPAAQFLAEFLKGEAENESPLERVERAFYLALERPQVHRVPGAMKSPRRVRSRLRKLFVANYPNQLHVLEQLIWLIGTGFLEEQAALTVFGGMEAGMYAATDRVG